MTIEDLRVLFKIPEEHESIFNQFSSKGGPIIAKILNGLSTWRDAPQVFIQHATAMDFQQHFKARLFIVDSKFEPVNGARITVVLDEQGHASESFTDECGAGIVDVDIPVPKDRSPKCTNFTACWKIVVEHDGHVKEVPLKFTGSLRGEYGIYMFLDRLVYKPGQMLLAKIIAWQQIDGIYRINQEEHAKIVILNNAGKKLFVKDLALDEFGCCNVKLPLSKELPEGAYQVQVRAGTTVKSVPIKVDYFKKPTIEVKASTTPDYIMPGTDLEIRAEARYYWEEPVADAEVRIVVEDEARRTIAVYRSRTGADGSMAGKITVPPSVSFKEGSIKVTVTDAFSRANSTEVKVPFSTSPMQVKVQKEILISGQENTVPVYITTPSNKPLADARVFAFLEGNAIVVFASATSNANGIASLAMDIMPVNDIVPARLQVEIVAGSTRDIVTSDIKIYPPSIAQETESKQGSKLELSMESMDVKIGDVARVFIKSETGLPVYIVVMTTDVLLFEHVIVDDGQAVLSITIDRRFWGNVTVQGYTLDREGDLIVGKTGFKVDPASKALDVHLDGLEADAYRPGDLASIAIDVLQDGQPVDASIAAALVDASVLALGTPREDPVDCMFARERQARDLTTLHTWNRALHVNEIVEFLELLNYLAYLDQDTILSTVYLLLTIDQHQLIDKISIQACTGKILDAVVRHSPTKTPLWLLLAGPDGSKFDAATRNDLATYVLVKWLDQGNEGTKIRDILNALGEMRRQDDLATGEFSRVLEHLVKLTLEKCPSLSIISGFLFFIDESRDFLDPDIAEAVSNAILADVRTNPLKRALTEAEYNTATIIFKPGSEFIAVGFAGLTDPADTPRCVIGYPKYTSIMTDVEHYSREYYVDETSRAIKQVVNKPPPSDAPKDTNDKEPEKKSQAMEHAIVSVRKWFPETALWLPDVIKKASEKCEIPVIFPDEIGRQNLAIIASTKDCEIGMATANVTIKQDFFVKMNLPARICLGDAISFSTIVTNNSSVSLECAIEIESSSVEISSVEGETTEIQATIPALATVAQKWRGVVKKIGPSIVKVIAQSEQFIDVIEHPIEVLPPGQPVVETSCIGITKKVTGEFRIAQDPVPVSRSLSLSILLDGVAGAIGGMERLIQYPHGCNEQISSAILASALIIQYLEPALNLDATILADARGKIERGLQELLSRKNKMNGWSWYNEDTLNLEITIQVAEALAEVAKIGYGFDAEDLIPTCTSLRAELLNILAISGDKMPISMGLIARAHELLKMYLPPGDTEFILSYLKKNISRVANDKDLALACIALFGAGEPVTNHLEWLKNRAKVDDDGVHWADDESLAGDVGATAAVMRLLARSGFDNSLQKKARKWILRKWDANTGFGSTAKNVETIRALLSKPEPRGTYDVTIMIDGAQFKTFHVTQSEFEERSIDMDAIELPAIEQDALVSISISSDLKELDSIATLVDKKWYDPACTLDLLEKQCSGVTISRKYDKIVARTNEPVTCTLQLAVREKQPMLVLEDAIPAGFILDNESLTTEIIHETTSYQIKFTLPEFDGEKTLSYKLIPTVAGNFIATGAKAYAMYDERKFITWTAPEIIKVNEP